MIIFDNRLKLKLKLKKSYDTIDDTTYFSKI